MSMNFSFARFSGAVLSARLQYCDGRSGVCGDKHTDAVTETRVVAIWRVLISDLHCNTRSIPVRNATRPGGAFTQRVYILHTRGLGAVCGVFAHHLLQHNTPRLALSPHLDSHSLFHTHTHTSMSPRAGHMRCCGFCRDAAHSL